MHAPRYAGLALCRGSAAAANVFARTLDVAVTLIDAGVCGAPIAHPALIDRRIGAGTANVLVEPAMTPAQLQQAFAAGHSLSRLSATLVIATSRYQRAEGTGKPVSDGMPPGSLRLARYLAARRD